MIFLCWILVFPLEVNLVFVVQLLSFNQLTNLENLNTTVFIPLTSNIANKDLKGNVFLSRKESGLSKDSVALIHQIIVVDKFRLDEKLSTLPKSVLNKIEEEIDYVLKD